MGEKHNKKVYILLTDTGTLFSKMIKWYTGTPYNHVSIVFDEKLNEIYSFGRKYPLNPFAAGFVKEDVYFGTYRYLQNTRCLLLGIDVTKKEYDCIKTMIQSFQKQSERYSYNLLGLLGAAIHRPIHPRNQYFCSQFVAEVFEKSGLNLWELPPALITPKDFFQQPRFHFIYEGRLYDYPLLNQGLLSLLSKEKFLEKGGTYECY